HRPGPDHHRRRRHRRPGLGPPPRPRPDRTPTRRPGAPGRPGAPDRPDATGRRHTAGPTRRPAGPVTTSESTLTNPQEIEMRRKLIRGPLAAVAALAVLAACSTDPSLDESPDTASAEEPGAAPETGDDSDEWFDQGSTTASSSSARPP